MSVQLGCFFFNAANTSDSVGVFELTVTEPAPLLNVLHDSDLCLYFTWTDGIKNSRNNVFGLFLETL